MENERRGDGKSQGETQRDARREKESQQARDRVRQVGQRDVERDRWKDREIKRQADRQTQIEGHFWKRNTGCRSYLLWEPGSGAGPRYHAAPHQGSHPSFCTPWTLAFFRLAPPQPQGLGASSASNSCPCLALADQWVLSCLQLV